jgi:5-methylcytosine-specific restriction endonuclease McrA
MPRKASRKTIVKKLDSIFSIYIRRRYAKNNITECVTCGKQDHWKNLQAGHFMSRKHYSTRWDEDNVEVQCMGCNVYRYGEQYLFAKYLGEEKSNELLIKSRQIQKFTDIELLELIEFYKHKVDNL